MNDDLLAVSRRTGAVGKEQAATYRKAEHGVLSGSEGRYIVLVCVGGCPTWEADAASRFRAAYLL